VTELFGYRVRKISTTGIISTVAGNGTEAYSGDGGPASLAQLDAPWGVVADSGGNLYISDSGNHTIRKIAANGVITTVAGSGIAGYSGDGGPAAGAQLNTPLGMAMDIAGNLYVADCHNQRIRKISSGGAIATVAGNGSMGYAGDGGPALGAKLACPHGVAIDPAGNIYIGDTENNRVRKVTLGGVISTIAEPEPRASPVTAGPPPALNFARRPAWRWMPPAVCTSPIPATGRSGRSLRMGPSPR